MKLPFQRFFFLLPLLLTVVLIIFGEALGDLWKEDVKVLFQQNKCLLLALVGLLWDRRQNNENAVPETVDKDQYDEAFAEFRKNLLEQYQGRLNSKTGRRLPVNLTAKSTDYGFDPERAKVFLTNQTIESDNIASETDKILNDNGRLLLIGDPGAGKTTILLYAALNILNKISGSSDYTKPSDKRLGLKLPLILNLATWREDRDFAEWYAQNIAHSYNLSPVFVQELLRRNAVVPFFDGFDEVAEDYRDDCLRKMAAYFGDDKSKQLIVSSRKKEYAAAKADAPVYAEIEVLPLSQEQIKRSLSENAESQAADRALLHAFEQDKWLAEAVETPFYLNTASFLFGKGQRTLDDFRDKFKADSTEGRQAELVEIFVAEQVPEEQDRKYLSFLAGKMEQENFLVFELVKMQPGWCTILWWFRLALSLVVFFLLLLISVFFVGIIDLLILSDPVYSPSLLEFLEVVTYIGIYIGLAPSLILGMFLGLRTSKISTTDIQIWYWKKFLKSWKKIGLWGLLGAAIGGVGGGIAYSTSSVLLFCFLGDDLPEYNFIDCFINWPLIFGDVLCPGLVAGFIGGLLFGIKNAGTMIRLLPHLPMPYQRFLTSFRGAVWETPIVLTGLIIFHVAFFWEDINPKEGLYALVNPVILVLFAFLSTLFILFLTIVKSQLFQHFSLRFVLHLEGKMPLRVVTFMDRMTDQLIFEDNRRSNKKGKKMRGATWRFRHKILQDYFARHSS